MPLLNYNTPIERYGSIHVKREDLCSNPPAPPFSKFRGVMTHLAKRPERIIGVLDTFHSQAGVAVAAACQALGKECINFWPKYKKEEDGLIRLPQQRSHDLGARLLSMKAGRSAILYHRAVKLLSSMFPSDAYMIANALKLEESVEETAAEVLLTPNLEAFPNIVVSISSGTIAGGVLRGLTQRWPGYVADEFPKVWVHMGYTRSHDAVVKYLKKLAPRFPVEKLELVDEGYQYADKVDIKVPFPCNPFYDAKAYQFLLANRSKFVGDVLLWNIG